MKPLKPYVVVLVLNNEHKYQLDVAFSDKKNADEFHAGIRYILYNRQKYMEAGTFIELDTNYKRPYYDRGAHFAVKALDWAERLNISTRGLRIDVSCVV